MQTPNNQPNNLFDEAQRVALTSKAGGFITRNLVKKAEEMLASNKSTVNNKWWISITCFIFYLKFITNSGIINNACASHSPTPN